MREQRSAILLAFPIILALGILLIPVVSDYSNHELAAEAVQQKTRWFAGHALAAIAFGIGALASMEIAQELRIRNQPVPAILPALMACGAALYSAGLGADGIAPVALLTSGTSPTKFFDGSGWWISGVFMGGTILFGLGLIMLVIRVIRIGIVTGIWRFVVFLSSIIFISAPAIPSGWALYGEAIAALAVFVPIGVSIRRSA
jgi:hypothetical protein